MSVQKQDHPSIKVLIAGISGSGKSTLFEKLIRREKNVRWYFLYDHKQGDLARRFGVRPCFTADELTDAVLRGGFVIFNPAKLFPGKPESGFEFFCRFVWAVCQELRGKKIFGTDELDALVDSRCKPDDLCIILDQGRTFQIDCYFIAHAPNTIHNGVRKQITEIFAMKQGDKNGTEWLEEKGFVRADLFSLKNGEFIYQNTNTGSAQRGGKAFEPKNAGRDLRGL
jgi:hypothetical protein